MNRPDYPDRPIPLSDPYLLLARCPFLLRRFNGANAVDGASMDEDPKTCEWPRSETMPLYVTSAGESF